MQACKTKMESAKICLEVKQNEAKEAGNNWPDRYMRHIKTVWRTAISTGELMNDPQEGVQGIR